MRDSGRRDQLRDEILHALSSDENIDNEGDLDYGKAADSVLAALLASGLLNQPTAPPDSRDAWKQEMADKERDWQAIPEAVRVPEGMTAERLRQIAEALRQDDAWHDAEEVSAWADALAGVLPVDEETR